jgi:TonB family protein
LRYLLLTAACMTPLAALGAPKFAYVHCSSGEEHFPALVYSPKPDPYFAMPAGSLNCGEKVQVLGREGPWLKIVLAGGDERYIAMTAISQRKDRVVAFDLPSPPEYRPKTGRVPPRPTHSPNPESTQEALDAGIHRMVILKLTVGADGLARDVKVLVGLGYGLDERARKAVQSWKFEPALQDGIPVDFRCAVEVSFPPDKQHP